MQRELTRLGRAIRLRRGELGLSQEELAHACGFDRTYISMLERGVRNPSLVNLIRLSRGLQTRLSTLVEACDGT